MVFYEGFIYGVVFTCIVTVILAVVFIRYDKMDLF